MPHTLIFEHGFTVERDGAELNLVLTIQATAGSRAYCVKGGAWNPPEPATYEVAHSRESGTGYKVDLTEAELDEICGKLAPEWAAEVCRG